MQIKPTKWRGHGHFPEIFYQQMALPTFILYAKLYICTLNFGYTTL